MQLSALVTDTANTMIFRPTPVTELKAQTIEAIIRSEVMEVRRQRTDIEDAPPTATCTFLPTVDAGLEAGQGRRQAIKRHLQELQRERRALVNEAAVVARREPDRPTSPHEIDVMEP